MISTASIYLDTSLDGNRLSFTIMDKSGTKRIEASANDNFTANFKVTKEGSSYHNSLNYGITVDTLKYEENSSLRVNIPKSVIDTLVSIGEGIYYSSKEDKYYPKSVPVKFILNCDTESEGQFNIIIPRVYLV